MADPAQQWFEEKLQELAKLLDNRRDPTLYVNHNGAEIEIRLVKVPGVYERQAYEEEVDHNLPIY